MSTFNVSILELSIVVLANISDLLTFVKLRMKNKNLQSTDISSKRKIIMISPRSCFLETHLSLLKLSVFV